MSFRFFLILLILGTIIAWAGWLLVIFYLDPTQLSWLGFLFFYAALALALSGTIFLAGDLIKSKIIRNKLLYYRVRSSVRQSILFAMLILGWLLLKSLGVLRWWNLLILILFLAAVEFFFISSQKHKDSYERGL
ncbi:MAG: hypothetical protein RB292_00485 [Patescibacteria group bacterium]|jgi:hypothetical protein|nr:hypothetical protein [Patescibacteria group bacterium]